MVDEFRHAEVPRSLSRIQPLLCNEVLQPLMVSIDVHLDTYSLVSPFLETVNNSKEFFVMHWLVALCSREGFCIVLN